MVVDLLNPEDCATLVPQALQLADRIDILHVNAVSYVGGDLVDSDTQAVDRMLNLNINVVIKNVHDVVPQMNRQSSGDIILSSSVVGHLPVQWEPGYSSSKWTTTCFVQTVRRQLNKHGIRVGTVYPGPLISALLADWPPENLQKARETGSLVEPSEVADGVLYMPSSPVNVTIRDLVILPSNFDIHLNAPLPIPA